jgi:ankyrin repeat protein
MPRLPVFALALALVSSSMSAAHASDDLGARLLRAAAAGDLAETLRLIGGGAPVDARDAQRRTPLLLAVDANHVDLARALLDAGASVDAQASNLDTPWLLAGARGRVAIIAMMLAKRPDLSIRNRFGGNALIPACERAHVEAVPLLLSARIDVNHVNNLGWTCLLEIVILGDGGPRHQATVRALLDGGANPAIADRAGKTPLQLARERGFEALAGETEARERRPR